MTPETDRLAAAFCAHEYLAPDSAIVLARTRQVARSYQRRRWAVRATGGAVLAAGIVAGGIAVPNLAHSGSKGATIHAADSGSPAQSPSSAATTFTQEQDFAAFFNAGYDYADAVQLKALWNDAGDIGAIKALAGDKLLNGEKLPIPPSGGPTTPVAGHSDGVSTATINDVNTFFDDGYTYNDAVKLGQRWNETDIFQVKADAGNKLSEGKALPVSPSGTPRSS